MLRIEPCLPRGRMRRRGSRREHTEVRGHPAQGADRAILERRVRRWSHPVPRIALMPARGAQASVSAGSAMHSSSERRPACDRQHAASPGALHPTRRRRRKAMLSRSAATALAIVAKEPPRKLQRSTSGAWRSSVPDWASSPLRSVHLRTYLLRRIARTRTGDERTRGWFRFRGHE